MWTRLCQGKPFGFLTTIREAGLTDVKSVNEANDVIQAARAKGFVTKAEMREEQKRRLTEELRGKSGVFTRDLTLKWCMRNLYILKYLEELKSEGVIYDKNIGTSRRVRRKWFIKD